MDKANDKKNVIFGYGEDALTISTLQSKQKRTELSKKLNDKLSEELNDKITLNREKTMFFYRPSFGRGFVGEPDFIIFTKTDKKGYWIIGESKWDESTEIKSNGEIKLKDCQKERIKKLKKLCKECCKGKNITADKIYEVLELEKKNVNKEKFKDSILYKTVNCFLNKAIKYFKCVDEVKVLPILVVFTRNGDGSKNLSIPNDKQDIKILELNYNEKEDPFIELNFCDKT